jgi:hypothetical protein
MTRFFYKQEWIQPDYVVVVGVTVRGAAIGIIDIRTFDQVHNHLELRTVVFCRMRETLPLNGFRSILW